MPDSIYIEFLCGKTAFLLLDLIMVARGGISRHICRNGNALLALVTGPPWRRSIYRNPLLDDTNSGEVRPERSICGPGPTPARQLLRHRKRPCSAEKYQNCGVIFRAGRSVRLSRFAISGADLGESILLAGLFSLLRRCFGIFLAISFGITFHNRILLHLMPPGLKRVRRNNMCQAK